MKPAEWWYAPVLFAISVLLGVLSILQISVAENIVEDRHRTPFEVLTVPFLTIGAVLIGGLAALSIALGVVAVYESRTGKVIGG